MRYICLIYENEALAAERSAAEQEAVFGEYFEFTRKVQEAGVYEGGDPLTVSTTATTIRVRDGQRALTDGPFAETREQLGGYYILDCKDLDEAIEWASQIPAARDGSVEVRPIMAFDG